MTSDANTFGGLTAAALDDLVQLEFPYPIAVLYKEMLEASDPAQKAELCLKTFHSGIRAISLALVIRYLRSRETEINFPELNHKIHDYLPESGSRMHQWIELLRDVLRAYKGFRDRLFIPELYDLYWETTSRGSQPKVGPWSLLEDMAALSNDIYAERINPESQTSNLMQKLRQILGNFIFMRNYDLWHVVSKDDFVENRRLTIDVWKGIRPHRIHAFSVNIIEPDFGKIEQGYYYIADRQGHLLELDPLLIDPSLLRRSDLATQDIGVFNAYTTDDQPDGQQSKLEYLLLAADIKEETSNSNLVIRFLDLYRDQISRKERVDGPRLPLSWENVRHALSLCSQRQMVSALGKYDDHVYVERTALSAVVQDFLHAPQSAMVITGDAGVGKTNLLMHVYLTVLLPRSDIAVLWLDGADLNTQHSLAQTLLAMLDEHVDFKDPTSTAEQAERALRRLIEGTLYEQSLVVILDGVNENNTPIEAFQKINEFINASVSLPIKVILSSRPQVWRYARQNTLKPYRQVTFFRRLAPSDLTSAISVEYDSFVLRRYTKVEEEQALTLYSRAEKIQNTALGHLNPTLAEALRDPLLLRITCEAYHGRAIPPDLLVEDIIPRLIERLVDDPSKTLFLPDIENFLEGKLVPHFFPAGATPVNRLTRNMLRKVKFGRGKTLDDLVADKTPYTDGSRVNQQFQNLMGTGWLVRTGESLNYEIRFRYEYFYDYFAGRYLTRLAEGQADKLAFFETWIAKIEQAPFLWGAIRNMLVSSMRAGDTKIVRTLAVSATSFRKDLLVSVLVLAHRTHPSDVQAILNYLIDARHRTRQSQFAPVIALETAYEVQNRSILTKGLCHRDGELRAITVQLIYQLWANQYPEVSLSILKATIDRLQLRHFRRTSRAFEGAVGATVLIALSDYQVHGLEGSHLTDIQQLWQPVVRRFRFLLGSKPTKRSSRWSLRRGVTRLVVPLMLHNAETVEKAQQLVFTMDDMRAYFPPTAQRKDLTRRLLPYFDNAYSKAGTIDELVSLIRQALETDDLLISYLVLGGLTATCVGHPLEIMPQVLKLFEHAKVLPSRHGQESSRPLAPAASPILVMVGQSIPYPELKDVDAKELLDIYGKIVLDYELHFGGMSRGTRRTYYWTELAEYSHWHNFITGDPVSPIMHTILDSICKERNRQKLRFLIRRFAHIARCSLWRETEGATVGLAGLREVIVRLDSNLESELEDEIAESIASIRAVASDKVDEFIESLSENDLSAKLLGRIKSMRPYINMGYVLGDAVIVFAKAFLIDRDGAVRAFVRNFVLAATESRSLNSWVTALALDMTDLVRGSFLIAPDSRDA